MDELRREIISGDTLDSAIKRGVDQLADTVKITMGPKGRLVLIQRPTGNPIVTKDGVTVANLINLVDDLENLGAQIIKQSASRTADEAGDGTTTATVLAQSIYTEGSKMKAAGFDVDLIKEGLRSGLEVALSSLESQKRDVKTDNDLRQVAMISANGEEDIANLIVSAIDAAGVDGEVIVEEAKGFKSSLTIVDGYQVERGFLSPYFITDKDKSLCEFKDPLVLMADNSYTSIHDLMKPLEFALDQNRPILVIANEIDGDALQGLVLNKVKGSLRICAIKSPGFGATRHELLGDLQSIIGGKILDSSFNMNDFDDSFFGTCNRIIVQKMSTLFICDNNETDESKSRISAIKTALLKPGLSNNEKELYQYRLRQLSGSIAILRVGAATEAELIERYDRVDDTLHATKAALQEGILPGGGIALVKAGESVKEVATAETDHAIKAGLSIISRACQEPFRQIVKNGGKSPDSYLDEIQRSTSGEGFDFRKDSFGDMFELGIVDPFKVTRCALENAVSAATILLSVGCSLIENKEKVSS
jgi:chaperonin GroEL